MSEQKTQFLKWCGGGTLVLVVGVFLISITQERLRRYCRRTKAESRASTAGERSGESTATDDLDPERAVEVIRRSLVVKKFEGVDDFRVEDETSQTLAVETDLVSETSSERSAESPKSPPHRLLRRMLSPGRNSLVGNSSARDEEEVRPNCKLCETQFRGGDNVCESSNPRCPHMFHETCINDWLQYQNSCPVCSETYVVLTN